MSVNCFSAPNRIAPGGVTGIATVLHVLVPSLPIGFTILAMNVPLLIMARLKISRAFAVRTVTCTVISTVVIDVSARFLPVYRGDLFLASVMGGVLAGVGLGLIFLRGGSTGGTEIVARLLERRFPHIPIGRLMLVVDAVVIAVAALVFGNVESAMYAVVMVFVISVLVDTLVYGGRGGKLVLIFSEQYQTITKAVLEQLNCGVTKLHSQGGYTCEERDVLLCAIRRTQVYALRRLVARLDPAAFLVITSAEEVFGKGFQMNE